MKFPLMLHFLGLACYFHLLDNSLMILLTREVLDRFSLLCNYLKLGNYSPPHPIFLVLKKFQIWMLQNILLFPCGIFTWYIFRLHQVFFDCSAPQSSLPCLQNLLRNKCELSFIIQRRECIWNENLLTNRFLETRNMKYIMNFTPFQKFQLICYFSNFLEYLVGPIASWL